MLSMPSLAGIARKYIYTLCINMRVSVCSVAQSCLTLCDPMDLSPPDSSVHGIFQARILDWIAISYSRGSSWPRNWTHCSCVCHIGRQILLSLHHLGRPCICIHTSITISLFILFYVISKRDIQSSVVIYQTINKEFPNIWVSVFTFPFPKDHELTSWFAFPTLILKNFYCRKVKKEKKTMTVQVSFTSLTNY